jgi:indolepyruvate decarboxylase
MLVGDFVVDRLEGLGLGHVIGVPGDYCLPLFERFAASKRIKLVGATDEGNAGFAADAYARMRGVGCVAATFGVGALKLVNAVAGAFAERSPLIVISGAPGVKDRSDEYIHHHVFKSYDSQRDIFRNVTCASAILNDPATAAFQLDRAMEVMAYKKQPIYVELPLDVAEKPVRYDFNLVGTPVIPASDAESLGEAMREVVPWIERARQPVILAGVQVARYGLGGLVMDFAGRTNIPVATTMLAKSTFDEHHRLFLGTYAGSTSSPEVQRYVEGSDCLLIFGELLSDMTVGFRPARFDRRTTVTCSVEGLKVRNHSYQNVHFLDFCNSLFKVKAIDTHQCPVLPSRPGAKEWRPQADRKVTTARFFEKVNSLLDENMTVVADPGDSLFGSMDLIQTRASNVFLGPAFYNSMGFAIPAALGAALAKPKSRVVVLVGDGSFQMASCTELSTILRAGLNPIVFVLNNRGYTTERYIRDGAFNDIGDWQYERITDLINGGVGTKVTTEGQLDRAVEAARRSEKLSVISVALDPKDVSPALRRMTEGLASTVRQNK